MRETLLRRMAIISCFGLLVLFAGATFLYLTPANPVKARHLETLFKFMHPLFAQNWHLFGPNPIQTNFVMLVRCRTRDRVTAWEDVSTPTMAVHHRNRFTSMGKSTRPIQGAMYLALGRVSNDEWTPLLCVRDRKHPLCSDNPARKKAVETGTFMAHRIACRTCAKVDDVQHVQIRILIHTPPPWSQRHESDQAGVTRYVTLPWMPYEPWEGNR